MKHELVIFDMGNTLLDFHAGIHTDEEKDSLGCQYLSEYFLEKYKINIPSNLIRSEFIDKWYFDFYKRKQLIELDVNDYISDFLEKVGHRKLKVDGLELMTEFYKAYIDEVVVNIGALESLNKLHGKTKVGVISNCILFDSIYEDILRNRGLLKYIDKTIFSYSRQIRKPDKRLFIEILDHFDICADKSVMIGDNYKADLEPAKKLGMKTILYNKKGAVNEGSDYEIVDLSDVSRIVEMMENQI